jgi:7-carboxy-7-deazaguanine synthase
MKASGASIFSVFAPGGETRKLIRVNEIFYSIQGESSHAGWPCVFVRLAGCNLRCAYCDTRYAYDEGALMTIEHISAGVRAFNCLLVEVTGGEPLIQEETPLLVESLLSEGFRVLVETNGSCDISLLDPRCARIVDIKCPSSGEQDANDYDNLERLSGNDELKFVVAERRDYEFARDLARRVQSAHARMAIPVNFSPVFGSLAPRALAEWILDDRLQARLNVQLHKVIWGPDARGV